MSSYLIFSKDKADQQAEAQISTDASRTVRRMSNEEENSDYKFRETGGTMDHERGSCTTQAEENPETSPLLTASCTLRTSGEISGEDSSTPAAIEGRMTSDDLEASSSFVDEYHQPRKQTSESRKNNQRYYPKKRKTSRGSTSSETESVESPCVNTSRVMEIYCLLLAGILFFALGLFGGRHIWAHQVPSGSPPSSVVPNLRESTDHDPSGNTRIPKITVGAYYYPWHGGDFHRGQGYVRKILGQEPKLGEYDDRDPKTISQHLEWSKQGNIGLWVTSWWGAYEREDNTTRTVILKHKELQKGEPFEHHKIALFYETFGRIRKEDQYSLHRLKPDMEFMCENYFHHPNYYTLDDGRPVLFVYLTRHLEELVRFESVVNIMRKSVKDACGKDVYIIGDQIFGRFDPGLEVSAEQRLTEVENNELYSSAPTAFDLLDGVTTYDVYGSMGRTVGVFGGYVAEHSVINYYLTEQRKWRKYAKEQKGCSFIPSVAPGYNDRGVRFKEDHNPLARSLKREKKSGGNDEGSFFRVSIEHARTLVDPSASYLLMVNSFNEWHEDTQIEPVIGESASTPYNMTFGMEYHGYETLYLDILRNGTKNVHIVV
ncbi:MAG: hypothetical protein SGBAC_002955 [Bacillariaceae sp.]